MTVPHCESGARPITGTTFQENFVRRKNDSAVGTFYRDTERIAKEALRGPRPNTPLEHALAVATLATFFGLFYILPMAYFAALYYTIVYQSKAAAIIVAITLGDMLLPAGQAWPAFSRSRVFDTWRRYFNLRVLIPELPYLKEGKKYLVTQFPHACFPFGSLLCLCLAGDASIGMPGRVHGVIGTVLLQIPFYKHFFAWMACAPASSEDIVRLLKSYHVGCIPEGLAGIFRGANRERERVYIRSRKGFIRLAIKTGADILPIYHLGNSQLLTYFGSEWLSRKARATIGMFWGWRGLPIPHQHDIIACIGRPIQVKQCDEPTDAQISQTHDQLTSALVGLYDQHKHLLGWENRPLQIV